MEKIIVKRGFDHEKIHYKAGEEVSQELAKLYPEHVKTVVLADPVEEEVIEEESIIEEEPVEEEVVEEPVEKPKKGKKGSKKNK